jgi:hypothetical protein
VSSRFKDSHIRHDKKPATFKVAGFFVVFGCDFVSEKLSGTGIKYIIPKLKDRRLRRGIASAKSEPSGG